MTPRRWGVGGWLVATAAGLVAAGGLVGLLVWDRRLFLLAVGVVTYGWCCYRIPNRNLLAELEATQMRLSAYNASDSRADLAEAPLTPPGGTTEVDPAPPSWMGQSGYRHPACICPWSDDGLRLLARYPACVIHGVRERPLATGGVVPSSTATTVGPDDGRVVRPVSSSVVPLSLHVSRGWGDDPFAPDCGCPVADCGLVIPQLGCLQHDNGKSFRQAHRVEDCPVYADPVEQPFVHTPCGTPISVLDDGAEWCPTCQVEITHETPAVACQGCGTDPVVCTHLIASKGMGGCCGACSMGDTHSPVLAEDDASDGPRSLPTPRVSD